MTVAFIHASRAAIEPVANYFTAQAPELDCVHLLDDGIMRFLADQDVVRSIQKGLGVVQKLMEGAVDGFSKDAVSDIGKTCDGLLAEILAKK